MILFANVTGIFILNPYSEIKKSVTQTIISTFKNPFVISCITGLLVNYLTSFNTGLREIIWINHSLDNIGNASLAMSLIAVGATLNIKRADDKMTEVIFCAVIKLILMPLLVFILLKFLNFNNELILICIIYVGSPCTSNATPMVASMGGDTTTMSLIISTQTVLSVFTIPVILFIYGMQLI